MVEPRCREQLPTGYKQAFSILGVREGSKGAFYDVLLGATRLEINPPPPILQGQQRIGGPSDVANVRW